MYSIGDIIMREGSDYYYEIMDFAPGARLAVLLLNHPDNGNIFIDQNEVSAHWGAL